MGNTKKIKERLDEYYEKSTPENIVREFEQMGVEFKPILPTFKPIEFIPKLSQPKKYGKYIVVRKDGKIHFEVWNGTGWAYNNNSITHFYKPAIK